MFRTHLPLILAFLLLKAATVSAQQRCGVVDNTLKLRQHLLLKEDIHDFEQWLEKKKADLPRTAGRKKAGGPYRIPVVFHIIHNGEPLDSGTNIPNEQIFSQMKVLNEDFQRRNADGTKTPAEFLPVAGAMDIQFVLARRDPNGNPTTGIVRVNGHREEWTSFEEFELKGLSYWPAEDYLNIWVCNLTNFLGLAQYPESDLEGLGNSPMLRETDGLMVQRKAFGSIDDGNFFLDKQYNKGRTVSHEIAHFLGLRHIWGDADGCTGSDYVNDTPNQDGSSSGCPKYPKKECSPEASVMFMNFMDYTDDRCMNMFTQQQVERMQIVLENSPRRKSLLTSPGLVAPGPQPNDLALLQNRPLVQCSKVVTPTFLVKNVGTNDITSVRIRFSLNDEIRETRDFPLNLSPGDSTSLSFTTLAVPDSVSTLSYQILTTNGSFDNNYTNDAQEVKVVVNEAEDFIPLKQDFEKQFKDTWTVANATNGMDWDTVSTNYGYSIYFNAFNNFEVGDESWLVSPTLDFSGISTSAMLFDVSHASRDGIADSLSIFVSEDCGISYTRIPYELDQNAAHILGWFPDDVNDWRNDEFVDLSAFAGQDDIRIAFVATNKSGNNLFIDNIEIFDRDPREAPIDSKYAIFGYNATAELDDLKIGFSLKTRQNVRCEIVNTLGKVITAIEWNDVVNQVFQLPLNNEMSAGPYIVRVRIDGKYSGKLIFKSH